MNVTIHSYYICISYLISGIIELRSLLPKFILPLFIICVIVNILGYLLKLISNSKHVIFIGEDLKDCSSILIVVICLFGLYKNHKYKRQTRHKNITRDDPK